jgi:hypothetical protein
MATKITRSSKSSPSISSISARMQFDYHKIPTQDPTRPWIVRPLIPIQLSHKGRHKTVLALLDSGADRSLFHASYAPLLGLDTEIGHSEQFTGIADEAVTAYFHTVELQIIGSPDTVTLEVGFTDSEGVDAILGQADFFQAYKVTFERYKEWVEIKPAPKK